MGAIHEIQSRKYHGLTRSLIESERYMSVRVLLDKYHLARTNRDAAVMQSVAETLVEDVVPNLLDRLNRYESEEDTHG